MNAWKTVESSATGVSETWVAKSADFNIVYRLRRDFPFSPFCLGIDTQSRKQHSSFCFKLLTYYTKRTTGAKASMPI